MANKRISELSSRTPSATDLMLVGDPTTGYSYKCLVSQVGGVTSVFGRTGAVTAQEGDYSLTSLSDVTITGPASGDILTYNGSSWVNSAGGFVPYTGATQNVSLGEYGILAGWYRLDTTPTGTPTNQGTIYWDDSFKTAAIIMNGTTQEIGHDQFYHAKNSTGTTIPKGTAVRFAGTDGGSGHLLIAPFLADGSNPSSYFMGVTAEAITNGSFGKVQSFGRLDGIDTSAFAEGDILYASTTVAGGFQTTVPVAPNNIVQVAAVVSDSNNGKLLIRPTLGSKLTSDESVKLTSVANGNVLQYNSTLAVWENVAPSSLAVNNIYTADGTLTASRVVNMASLSLSFASNGNATVNYRSNSSADNFTITARGGDYGSAYSYIGLNDGNVHSRNSTFEGAGIYFDTRGQSIAPAFSIATASAGGSSTRRLNVFGGGNIGINTTTDAGFRLDVNGTMRVQGNLNLTNGSYLWSQDAFHYIMPYVNSGTYTGFVAINGSSNGILLMSRTLNTREGYSAQPDQAISTTVTRIDYDANAKYTVNGSGTLNHIGFYYNPQITNFGTTNLTSIHTLVGNALFGTTSGNVGIGTTSPTYKLHTVGTGRITGNVELSVDSGAYTIIGATGDTTYRLSVDGDLRVYGSVRTANPSGGTSTKWRLGSYAAATVQLDTSGYLEVELNGTAYKVGLVMLP